jgi:CubicO group peptidase (beta-lactamase class C family)
MMARIKKKNYDIDSILIVRNGIIVLDAYFWPFTRGQKHNIASCTKSIVSALIGIAMDKGFIRSINQPVIDFFQDKKIANMDDRKKSITIENLLMMSSGLKCTDTYRHQWEGLYEMRNNKDWAQYVLDLPMAEFPGKTFEYCNGVSFLLSAIISNTTKVSTLDFARNNLFTPIGIVDVDWATSPQGNYLGYGEMWLTPRDMARIGWLYLNKGCWGKQQIVPSAWVEASSREHIDATLFDHYGYQWWIDSDGYYMAVGHGGQRIFVVPGKNLVVVFTGQLEGKENFIPEKLLEKYIIPASSSVNTLPADVKRQGRLNDLVSDAAKAGQFVWTSAHEGIAQNCTFRRTASPAFQFQYPIGSKKAQTEAPGQIMRLKSPGNVVIYASIIDIPDGIKIDAFGPQYFCQMLRKYGSNIKVTSNKEITLRCGSKTYRTNIEWVWNHNVPMTTFLVTAYKDGKSIFLNTLTWDNPQRCEPIIQSLIFE